MIDETLIYEDDYKNKCRYTLEKKAKPIKIGKNEAINVCVTMTAIDEITHVTLTDKIHSKDFEIIEGSNTASSYCLYPGDSLHVDYLVKPNHEFTGSIDLDSRVEITYKKEKNKKIDTYTEFNDSIDIHKRLEPKKDEVSNVCCCEAKCKTVCLSSCDDTHFEKVIVDDIPCSGKTLKVPIVLKNVCRNKSIAIGIFLKQKICCGGKKFSYKDMGFRIIEVPAEKKPTFDKKDEYPHKKCESCKDIKIEGICFVLPVDLCDVQDIEIHVLANYLTFDYEPQKTKY